MAFEFVPYASEIKKPHPKGVTHIVSAAYIRGAALSYNRRVAYSQSQDYLAPDLSGMKACVAASDLIMTCLLYTS